MQRATNRERKSRNLTLEQVVVVLSVIVVIIGRGVSGEIGAYWSCVGVGNAAIVVGGRRLFFVLVLVVQRGRARHFHVQMKNPTE